MMILSTMAAAAARSSALWSTHRYFIAKQVNQIRGQWPLHQLECTQLPRLLMSAKGVQPRLAHGRYDSTGSCTCEQTYS